MFGVSCLHWWWGDISSPQHKHCSSLKVPFLGDNNLGRGVSVLSFSFSAGALPESFRAFPLCIFKPLMVWKVRSQRLHLKLISSWLGVSKLVMKSVSFTDISLCARQFCFLFMFLLRVKGHHRGCGLPVVQGEREGGAQGEGEGMAPTGQLLAEMQALFSKRFHFLVTHILRQGWHLSTPGFCHGH